MEQRNKDLKTYLGKVKWALAVLIAAATAIGIAKPNSPFCFPPAGPQSEFVLPFSYIAICAALLLPWFINSPTSIGRLAISAGIFIPICLLAYLYLIQTFVVSIDIPAKQKTIHVIAGYERTTLAELRFSGISDAEMLKRSGFDENTLNELYTKASRTVTIGLIFSAYIGLPFALAFLIGCASRRDQLLVLDKRVPQI
jgi:hypothetical protein